MYSQTRHNENRPLKKVCLQNTTGLPEYREKMEGRNICMRIPVFWDVMLRRLERVSRHSEGFNVRDEMWTLDP